MIFNYDLPAACRDMDGDIWFPEAIRVNVGEKPKPKSQDIIDTTILALAICNTCPIQQTCLQAAIDNRDEHGIWGGTFPYERHTVAPYEKTMDLGFIWQSKLRKFAEQKGLVCPPLPAPTPGYVPAESFSAFLPLLSLSL